MAKQLATLDVLSRGRLDIGLGTGWHRAEYAAPGVSFEDRIGQLDEQIQVCCTLWKDTPATYHGRYVNFDRIYALPKPSQPSGIPIWLRPANWERIASSADGWLPLGIDAAQCAQGVIALREAYKSHGRNPADLAVRHLVVPSFDANGVGLLDAALASVAAWVDAGATHIEWFPTMFCRRRDQFEGFLERILTLKLQSTT